MGKEEERTVKAGDLDAVVNDQIKSYQSIVGGWLKNSTAKKSANPAVSQSTEPLNQIGRPARLGIGAKATSQRDQISNSVFLNQKLAKKLTGQSADPKTGSFMHDYRRKEEPKPSAKSRQKEVDSDEEDSRSKLIGKKPLHNLKNGINKKRK